MKVRDLITKLQALDPDLLLVESRCTGDYYVGYEGWWPTELYLVPAAGVLANRDMYFEYDETVPEHAERDRVEAIVLGGS